MRKILLSLAVAILSVALPGCIFRGSDGTTVAVIPGGHVHSVSCGHYSDRGSWRYQENHVHSGTCGHVLVSGTWSVRN